MTLPKITKQEMLESIREGVHDAIWQMITNNTDMPCAYFFDQVKAGVREAVITIEHGRKGATDRE